MDIEKLIFSTIYIYTVELL